MVRTRSATLLILPLLLFGRKLAGAMIAPVRQPRQSQQLVCTTLWGVLTVTGEPDGQFHVLQSGQCWDQVEELKHKADLSVPEPQQAVNDVGEGRDPKFSNPEPDDEGMVRVNGDDEFELR